MRDFQANTQQNAEAALGGRWTLTVRFHSGKQPKKTTLVVSAVHAGTDERIVAFHGTYADREDEERKVVRQRPVRGSYRSDTRTVTFSVLPAQVPPGSSTPSTLVMSGTLSPDGKRIERGTWYRVGRDHHAADTWGAERNEEVGRSK